MGHLFISYSRRDLEPVNGIVTMLEQAGLSVWIDRERIKAGRTWRAQIVQAIDTCDAFLLMLSSNSSVSENVRKEIDLAQDAGRTVFILKLDSVMKVPAEMRYQLVGLQSIDLPVLGLEDAVVQLIDTLKEHLSFLKPDEEQAVRQVEFVIQGVNPSLFGPREQEQLLDVIAAMTQTPESQLQIAKLAGGSVHVFVDMSGPTAFELKAGALNRDRHLKHAGIKSLRIVGDRKYVNISLGILTTSAAIGALHLLWLSFPSLFSSALGFTGGKILFLASVIVIVTAIGLAASKAVLPMLNPAPALPRAGTPSVQGPLVIRDALCWLAPGSEEVSSIQAGTHVGLLGRGSIPGWLIVQDPISGNPCWMETGDLQIDPGYNVLNLAVFTPPTLALPVNQASIDATPVPSLPVELPDLTTPVCGVLPCTPVPGLP